MIHRNAYALDERISLSRRHTTATATRSATILLYLLISAPCSAQTMAAEPNTSSAEAKTHVLINQAATHLKKGASAAALKQLLEAVRAAPDDVLARRYLAYTLIHCQQPEEAIKQMRYVNMLARPSSLDHYISGEAYHAMGSEQAAEELLRRAVQSSPGWAAARGALARVLASQQKYQEAANICLDGESIATDTKTFMYFQRLLCQLTEMRASTSGSSQSPCYGSSYEGNNEQISNPIAATEFQIYTAPEPRRTLPSHLPPPAVRAPLNLPFPGSG